MRNIIKKRNILFLLLLLIISAIIIPQSSSKYKTTLQKELTLNIRQPEYDVVFNQIIPEEYQEEFNHIFSEEYQEVEYIESTGTQYIDTGYNIKTKTDKVMLDCSITRASSSHLIFGIYTSELHYGLNFYDDAGRLLCYNSNTAGVHGSTENIPGDTRMLLIQNPQSVTRNGNEIITLEQSNINSSTSLFLFAANNGVTKSYLTNMKLYHCKIYNDNILVRNFIPCYRKTDNKPGLYDLVTNTFYTNAGTGEFIAGPAIKSQHFVYGTAQNLTANTYIKTGYSLKGWATSANGEKVYDDGQLVNNLSSVDGAIVNLYPVWEDDIAPLITVTDTRSYVSSDFSDWTLTGGAYIDENGALVMPSSSARAYKDFEAFGTKWDSVYKYKEYEASSGAIFEVFYYYNNNYEELSRSGYRVARAHSDATLTWKQCRKESQVAYPAAFYTQVRFSWGDYATTTYMIKDFKFVTDRELSKEGKLVYAEATDDGSGLKLLKWLPGTKTVEDFENDGTALDTYFEVTENGIYTIYAEDNDGNKSVEVITVTGIDKVAPTVNITKTDYNTFNWTASDENGIRAYSITNTNTIPRTWTITGDLTSGSYDINPDTANTYYVWVEDNAGNISSASISSYLLTKDEGEGTTLTIKADAESLQEGTEVGTTCVLEGTKIYADAKIEQGYSYLTLTSTGATLTNNKATINENTIITSTAVGNNYQNLTTLKYYQTLNDAFAEVENGQIIQAIADDIVETTDATLSSNKTTIVDVNGKHITFNNKKITNNGTLDIYSSVDGAELIGLGTRQIVNYGTLTVNGTSYDHTISLINTATSASARVLLNYDSSAVTTLNDNVTITYNNPEAINDNRYLITNTGTLYIDGTTLTNNITGSTRDRGILNANNATARVVMTSGTINTYGMSIYNSSGTGTTTPAVEISGANTTIATHSSSTVYNGNNTGKILISGGTLSSTTYHALRNHGNGIIDVTGGDIIGDRGIFNEANGTINVSGGTINGKTSSIYNTANGTINVSGGTIDGTNYGIYNNANGTINVSGNNTQITSTSGTGIRGTTGAVTVTGGTITGGMYGVYTTSTENNIGSMNISGGNITSDSMALFLSGSSTLTMSGGAVESTEHSGIYIASDGTATVTGGSVTGYTTGIYNEKNGTITVSGNSTVITATTARGIRGETGTVIVSDGTIIGASHGISATSDENNTGTVTITGGTITGRTRNGINLEGNAILTLGTDDNSVSTVSPVIQTTGSNNDDYGVYMSDTAQFNFYDGIVISASGVSINKDNTFITDTPSGYTVLRKMNNGKESAYLTPTYTVTYNANGGTGVMQDQEFAYEIAQNLSQNVFIKMGYNFEKWNTHANGTGNSYTDGQNVINLTNIPNGRVNLFARWKPNFTVTGNPEQWTNQDVTLTVITQATTNTFEYSFDGGNSWQSSPSKTYTQNQNQIQIKIRDTNGNESNIQTIDITKIDKVAPTINFTSNQLIVTLDESNPIENLITAIDNESGIDSNGLKVYRYEIANDRRTDQITNTTYFTYPGLYAIDIELTDIAGNITSLNSEILVRWPTAGKYVVRKTELDGAGIIGTGLATDSSKMGLYRDNADTGLDSSLGFSSKYYYAGKTVNNYFTFDKSNSKKNFRILNVAVNDEIKLVGNKSSDSIRYGTHEQSQQGFLNTELYQTFSGLWNSKQFYIASNDAVVFNNKEWAHIDGNATYYIGGFKMNSSKSIASTVNCERNGDSNWTNATSYTGYSAFPNVSDYLKTSNQQNTVYSINSSSSYITFANNSWLASGIGILASDSQWTINGGSDGNMFDRYFYYFMYGNQIGDRNPLDPNRIRVTFYVNEDTIISGTGTSSDPFTVQEDWAWFDNAQVLQ